MPGPNIVGIAVCVGARLRDAIITILERYCPEALAQARLSQVDT
jgi:hypothetical protein